MSKISVFSYSHFRKYGSNIRIVKKLITILIKYFTSKFFLYYLQNVSEIWLPTFLTFVIVKQTNIKKYERESFSQIIYEDSTRQENMIKNNLSNLLRSKRVKVLYLGPLEDFFQLLFLVQSF